MIIVRNLKLKNHFLRLLFLTLFVLMLFPGRALASNTPGRVSRLTAKASESQVVLRWKKVNNASGYYIYRSTGDSAQIKKIATVKGGSRTSYTNKKLKNNVVYTYYIAAYRKTGRRTYMGDKSKPVRSKPRVITPSVPALKIFGNNSGSVSLAWGKSSKATGYQVLYKNGNSYQIIGKVKNSTNKKSFSYTVGKLTNGQTYDFVLRAYRTVGEVTAYSNISNKVTGRPAEKSAAASAVHGAYYTVQARSNIPGTPIRKGAKALMISGAPNTSTATLQYKGKTYSRISTSKIKILSYSLNGKKVYSKSQAEAYVNYKGYSSTTKYLVWINLYTQRIYIFRGRQYNWKLYKTSTCSTGLLRSRQPDGSIQFSYTKNGVAKISCKEYEAEFVDCYGRWVTYFWGYKAYAIHTWVMQLGTSNTKIGPVRFGAPASQGCARVPDAFAQWVYKYIPIGTTSVVY